MTSGTSELAEPAPNLWAFGPEHGGLALHIETVIALYSGLLTVGVQVWLDGGWGVDALLGEQTRAHSDLDIVVQETDLPAMSAFLAAQGFAPYPRDDTRAWNYVLANARQELIDVHVICIDLRGDGIYGPAENGQFYPAAALAGRGRVGGLPVFCLSPEYQLESHRGYRPREKDRQDVRALVRRFDLIAPPEYGQAEA